VLKQCLRLEIKKAIQNRYFVASIAIGCLIALVLFFTQAGAMTQYFRDFATNQAEGGVQGNPFLPMFTVFNQWLGGLSFGLAPTVFFFIFPLLISIPYGWSHAYEQRNGYIRQMVLRMGRRQYYVSKYAATFISAGLAMVIPLLFSFLISLIVFPAITPDVSYYTSYGVFAEALMSQWYYSQPFLYVGAYLLLDFFFCGLLGGIAFAIAASVKNRITCMLAPFFIAILFEYLNRTAFPPQYAFPEFSPLNFLHPAQFAHRASWIVIIAEAVLLVWLTLGVTMLSSKKREIY